METITYVNVMALSSDGAGSATVMVDPEAYSSNKTVEAATETAKEQAIDAYESEIGDRAAIRRFVIQVLTTPAFKPIETSVSVALPEAGADDSTVTVTVS